MIIRIGGQLNKAHYNDLFRTMPGHIKDKEKGRHPDLFYQDHRNPDDSTLIICCGSRCSLRKTADFCKKHDLPFELTSYGVERWAPGYPGASVGAGPNVTTSMLEEFVNCVDAWTDITQIPLYINDETEEIAACAKHVLATGRIDKYELFKLWFKNYLPYKLPPFKWIE